LLVPSNNPKMDIERKLQQNPDLFFVGEVEGKIVSTCMSGYDGHRGWIYYLAVSPRLRRKGIAVRMVRHAERALKTLGCPKIDLMVRNSNEGVIAFYHKIGYNDDPVVVLSKRLKEDKPYR
jgi:ribosomal protein S18 acetylase RimI-like enzyme